VQHEPKFLLRHHLVTLGVPSLDLLQRQVLETRLQARGLLCEFKH